MLDEQKVTQMCCKKKAVGFVTGYLRGIWGALLLLARDATASKAGLRAPAKIFYGWYQGALQESEMNQTFLHITRIAKGII